VRSLGVLIACASGCGRIAFEEPLRLDAGVDGEADAGGADAGPSCWPAWRSGTPTFGSVSAVSELADPAKQGNPWLAADGRTLYFDSGTGDTELYRAVRAGAGQPFGPRVQLTELTSPVEDTGLVIIADERVAVISSSRTGSLGFDLWQTERAGPGLPFDPPSRVPYAAINDSANQFDAFLSADGLRVFYATSIAGGQVLRMSSRASTSAAFAAPVPIPGTGTLAVEADPELSPDELVLVFSANLPLSLHAAVRASPGAPFGAPFALSSIVGSGYDGDPTLSADGCELFFISDRGGDRDLHRAVVVP